MQRWKAILSAEGGMEEAMGLRKSLPGWDSRSRTDERDVLEE